MKYRYKVYRKDGTSLYMTTKTNPKEMESWKRAYNKNYANGIRASKNAGISKIVKKPLVKKRQIRTNKSPFGVGTFKMPRLRF
jgi:hypothetical protein